VTAPNLIPFASLVLETPQFQWSNWPTYLATYFQDGGGFALLGIWVWIVASFLRSVSPQGRRAGVGVPLSLLVVAVASLALYLVGGIGSLIAAYSLAKQNAASAITFEDVAAKMKLWNQIMSVGGALALLGVFVPFLRDNLKLRFRRVWALARLAFVEAVRRRVIWVFLIFAVLFLFPPKWFFPIKPEDELSANVSRRPLASRPTFAIKPFTPS
jgi:hypothetical protein